MREIRKSGSMRGCRKRATLAARLRPTPHGVPHQEGDRFLLELCGNTSAGVW
jgi:hypothetical protein